MLRRTLVQLPPRAAEQGGAPAALPRARDPADSGRDDAEALLGLFMGTPDAAIAIDDRTQIVAWNAGSADLFGLTPRDVLGMACSDVFDWRDRHGNLICGAHCPVRASAGSAGGARTMSVLGTGPSGRATWLSVTTLVLPVERHRVCRLVHLVHEVAITPGELGALRGADEGRSAGQAAERLTARERAVLDLLATGASTAEIADRLVISRTTVQNHVAHVLAKLGAHSRLEAVALDRAR
jgi:DNA-binding CsgD family transcriptional regulator